MAPNRDVVKPERVPPQIKHRLIEAQDPFPSDAWGRRCELSQTIVDEHSRLLLNPRQQVPQC